MFGENCHWVIPQLPLQFVIESEIRNVTQAIRTNPAISLEPFKLKHGSVLSKYYNKEEKRSMFSNISVKVQTQIYHLDKAMLALNSGYFEKLLVEGIEGKECTEIEIHTIDEDIFSFIVENIIYGAKLRYDIMMRDDGRNIAKLFMAMNFLKMEMDLQNFQNVITSASWSNLDKIPAETFKFYDFVSSLPTFEPILCSFRKCFSKHLPLISKMPEFMSLSPNALIEILISPTSPFSHNVSRIKTSQREERLISKICAEWICCDFQNRIPNIIELVNAAKRRFGTGFAISSDNEYKTFEESDEIKRRQLVEKYFYKLLNCSAEISCEPATINAEKSNKNKAGSGKTIVNEIDHEAKWKTFLKQKHFSDVSIRVGEKVFHLHRIKLSLEVPYFYDLFSQSTIHNEYSLDAVDCAAFKKIVDYIYYGEIDVINENQIGNLLKACKFLKMEHLSEEISQHFTVNVDKAKSNIFDFLKYVLENENFSLHRLVLDAYFCLAWDEISKQSKFYELSFDILEHLITLRGLRLKTEQDLLNVCSKWVYHDVQNRYKLIPELALAINRNSMEDHEKYSSVLPKDSSTYSEENILQQLNNILSLTQPISTRSTTSAISANTADSVKESKSKPCFMISKKSSAISILDENLDEILSLNSQNEFRCSNISAAIVEDNLFMLLQENDDNFSFQAYNLNSKKIISSSFNSKNDRSHFRLLNCNNTLYFCGNREDVILKYSCRLNRWIVGFQNETKYYYQYYTSDGKNLFKVFEESYQKFGVQSYNFENKSWINLPHPLQPHATARSIQDVSIIDGKLGVLFESCTAIYRQENHRWQIIGHNGEEFIIFKQVKDSILYVSREGRFYSLSIANKTWQSLKKLEEVVTVVAIHSVK